jgi:hypothetical protein
MNTLFRTDPIEHYLCHIYIFEPQLWLFITIALYTHREWPELVREFRRGHYSR